MVDFGSVLSGLEEVHAVQVGDVHTPVRGQSVHEALHTVCADTCYVYQYIYLVNAYEKDHPPLYIHVGMHLIESSPGIWSLAVRPVLLNVHAKEANVHAVNLLKHKHGLGPIGVLGGEIPCKPIPHEGACVERLVGGGDHSDGHITRS